MEEFMLKFLRIFTMLSSETFFWHYLPGIPRSAPSTEPLPKKQEFRFVYIYVYFDMFVFG